MLSAEVKALREEGHRCALELTERAQRAAVLRAKHAALASQLVGADGVAEERSQVGVSGTAGRLGFIRGFRARQRGGRRRGALAGGVPGGRARLHVPI